MRFRAAALPLTVLPGLLCIQAQTVDPTERIVFISGDVRLADGSPPAEPVLIQRLCKGRVIFAARTDASGHYSFSVGGGGGNVNLTDATQPAPQAPDLGKAINMTSSQYTNPISTALQDCVLQAVLGGFGTASLTMSGRTVSDDGRMGTLILHPIARSAALTVSATTAAAPANASKAYEKGLDALAKQKWDAAAAEFTKAVKIYPAFAIAWHQLGELRYMQKDFAGATDAWKQALKQDPQYARPYESLAALADRQQDWPAAELYSRGLCQLDPDDFPAAYLINAVANARLGHIDAAEQAARTGVRIDRDRKLPRLQYVLGLILMEKGNYSEAAANFRAYLELAPNAPDAPVVAEQLKRLQRGLPSAMAR